MALPVVKTLAECANYSSTVEPYIYQLRPFPQVLLEAATNTAALKQIYLDTNPLISGLAFSIALGPIFLVASEINKNYSQVDRFWSLLPTVYNIHYAVWARLAGYNSARLDLLAIASSLWSSRLTYNYYRKGGYSIGSEDYRWNIVKDYIGQPLFFLFNVTFISFIQSVLLWSITTPGYILLLVSRLDTANNRRAFEIGDSIAFGTMVTFVVLSAVSDQQQWNYHQAKDEYKKTARVPAKYGFTQAELDRGFLTKGLWSASRHPNFASEQSVWCTLYAWSCYSTGTLYNWSSVGAFCYLILFQGSTWLTELLTGGKYPEYKEYQSQIAKFMPLAGNVGPPVFSQNAKKQIDNNGELDRDAQKARERYDLR